MDRQQFAKYALGDQYSELFFENITGEPIVETDTESTGETAQHVIPEEFDLPINITEAV